MYKKSYSTTNPILNGTNDWLLGDNYSARSTELFNNSSVTNAYIIDGPWSKSTYSEGDGAVAVPNVTNGVQYVQAPGGWVYGINQRNFDNPTKIAEMKDFLNILLTDPEVIRLQYDYAGKIIDGNLGRETLENDPTYGVKDDFDKSVLEAVFDSQKMDSRPDGGNTSFDSVWSAWDEQGWSFNQVKALLADKNTDEASLKSVRDHFVTDFNAMLKGF